MYNKNYMYNIFVFVVVYYAIYMKLVMLPTVFMFYHFVSLESIHILRRSAIIKLYLCSIPKYFVISSLIGRLKYDMTSDVTLCEMLLIDQWIQNISYHIFSLGPSLSLSYGSWINYHCLKCLYGI